MDLEENTMSQDHAPKPRRSPPDISACTKPSPSQIAAIFGFLRPASLMSVQGSEVVFLRPGIQEVDHLDIFLSGPDPFVFCVIEVKKTTNIPNPRIFLVPCLYTDCCVRASYDGHKGEGVLNYLMMQGYNSYYSSEKIREFKENIEFYGSSEISALSDIDLLKNDRADGINTFLTRVIADYVVLSKIDPQDVARVVPLNRSVSDRDNLLAWVDSMIDFVKHKVMEITEAEKDVNDPSKLVY
ncbi:Hypothetical protein POVR1_LOCUS290 [uncultured virus]|nr:Hypothetical protein POVR1_LOCUS290 [uncultured virus]